MADLYHSSSLLFNTLASNQVLCGTRTFYLCVNWFPWRNSAQSQQYFKGKLTTNALLACCYSLYRFSSHCGPGLCVVRLGLLRIKHSVSFLKTQWLKEKCQLLTGLGKISNVFADLETKTEKDSFTIECVWMISEQSPLFPCCSCMSCNVI